MLLVYQTKCFTVSGVGPLRTGKIPGNGYDGLRKNRRRASLLGAAILTGGKSTRMGHDKALLAWNSVELIDHVISVLRGIAAIGQVYVIGDRHPYRDRGATVVADDYPEKGPLGGIATALRRCDEESILIVAVDMPFLSPTLLGAMISYPFAGDALVPCFDGLQPLHAIYRRTCLAAIERQIAIDRLKITDAYEFLDIICLHREWIEQYDREGRSFGNVNTPDDLQRLQMHAVDELDR
jgi:molybdenum cofactor guanylyltransferase